MKNAKIFSLLVLTIVAIYGAIGWYMLPLANFDGDLTRIGKVPETLFGWTRPQVDLAPRLFVSAPWREADVLVIGDSFSAGRVWQTRLTQAGLRVHTETWNSLHAICGNFAAWIKNAGFKGRYIVIEVVERNAQDTLNASLACDRMVSVPATAVGEFYGPPPVRVDRTRSDRSGRLSVGIETWLNGRRYQHLAAAPNFVDWRAADNVLVARVADGCALFSHVSCRDALFYGGDHTGDFDTAMLDKMAAIDTRLPGYQPIWLIVPDKTTTYLHPDKQFWREAQQRFHAPDVLADFRQAIAEHVVDLYPANNTHLSTRGYLRMGALVLARIRELAGCATGMASADDRSAPTVCDR